MTSEDWFWYLACNQAKQSRFLKRIYWSSGIYFIVILFFAVVWHLIGLWNIMDSLTYTSITLLLWAAFVNISDRIFLDREQINAICKDYSSKNLNSISLVVKRKKLGIIVFLFLFGGFLSQVGIAFIAALSH